MIKVNLLKPLQAPAAPLILEEPKGRRKAMVLAAGGLALVAAAAIVFLQYPSLLSGGEEARIAETPSPATGNGQAGTPAPGTVAAPKRVTADAVEEIVREIQEEQGRQGPVATYADLVPSEKIEYQYFAANRILRDIKAVTPPDIGFAHFIFTPPGDFYIHGLAYDEATYQRFQDGLNGLEGASIRPGVRAQGGPVGAAGPSGAAGRAAPVEFSFYGTVNYPVQSISQPPDRVVKEQDLKAELKRLKEVAATLGIALRSPKLKSTTDAGDYRTMIFQASADCSYQQMQELLSRLQENKSNLGFLKFALKASGDESVTASFDILAYVN